MADEQIHSKHIHQQTRLISIADLMETGKYSDLTIVCGGKEFPVHKAVVCTVSNVLARECESSMKEGSRGIIEHTEFNAETMRCMLAYAYRQTYEVDEKTPKDEGYRNSEATRKSELSSGSGDADTLSNVTAVFDEIKVASGEDDAAAEYRSDQAALEGMTGINKTLIAHTHVYGIADYYNIPTLKVLAVDKFAHAGDVFGDLECDGFVDVIRAVNEYEGGEDRTLRWALRDYAMSHRTRLVHDEKFMDELANLNDVPDFAVDMFRAMVNLHTDTVTKHEMSMAAALAQEARVSTQKLVAEHARDVMEERAKQVEDNMMKLLEDLENLPDKCRNRNCDREFGNLLFERKGHPAFGPGGTAIQIKCGRCRCKHP